MHLRQRQHFGGCCCRSRPPCRCLAQTNHTHTFTDVICTHVQTFPRPSNLTPCFQVIFSLSRPTSPPAPTSTSAAATVRAPPTRPFFPRLTTASPPPLLFPHAPACYYRPDALARGVLGIAAARCAAVVSSGYHFLSAPHQFPHLYHHFPPIHRV